MSFFSKLFGRKTNQVKIGGMEDYMTLVRVYYQASMASRLGISNLAVFPDLRVFKQTLKVPTVNNKLGLGEKKKCQKMNIWKRLVLFTEKELQRKSVRVL